MLMALCYNNGHMLTESCYILLTKPKLHYIHGIILIELCYIKGNMLLKIHYINRNKVH